MNKKDLLVIIISSLIVLGLRLVLFFAYYKKDIAVSFDTDGGNKIDTLYIKVGNKISKIADPTKEGYTFKGWTYKNGDIYHDGDKFNKDTILYASWEEIVPENDKDKKPSLDVGNKPATSAPTTKKTTTTTTTKKTRETTTSTSTESRATTSKTTTTTETTTTTATTTTTIATDVSNQEEANEENN